MKHQMLTDGVNNKCGRGRGCRVVDMPFDTTPNHIGGHSECKFFSVFRLPPNQSPNWKVVRWDVEPTARKIRQAAG